MYKNPMDQVLADTRIPVSPPSFTEWSNWSKDERDEWAAKHLTPEEWAEAKHKLDKALIQLIIHFPFFGFMASSMAAKKVWVTSDEMTPVGPFRTMSTDGKTLYIWPQFALYHDVKRLMGVLLHELFHNVLLHLSRGVGYDPALANIAMDYSVNLMVNDAAMESAQLTGQKIHPGLYDRLNWYVPVGGKLPGGMEEPKQFPYDEKYRDEHGQPMMWEDIYKLLKQEAGCTCGNPRRDGDSKSDGGEPNGGCPIHGKTRLLDDHGFWKPGNRPADENGEVNDEKFDPSVPQRWAMDANAKCSGDMRGTVPAGMKRRIEEWLNPPLPWYRLLQAYMKLTPSEFSWAPGDIRFPDPMPWISEVPDLTYVTFGFDTSGSMSQEEIAGSVENARSILRGFPSMKGRAYFWDAAVHDKMDLEEFEGVYEKGVGGGGGTSIRPQFLEIEEDGITPKTSVHVCFTDGYVDWNSVDPDKLEFDVLWVITNDHINPPEHPRYRMTRLNVH